MAWDNADDYKYTESNNMAQWAWEFIRRNPKYIQQWKEKLAAFHIDEGDNKEINHISDQLKKCLPKDQNDYPKEFQNFRDPTRGDFEIISEKTDWGKENNEWGVMNFYDPEVIWGAHIQFCSPEVCSHFFDYASGEPTLNVPYSSSLVCSLKIGLPLEPQLKVIKNKAKKLERKILGRNLKRISISKRSSDVWTLYLRILDALATSVKPKKIQDTLFAKTANPQQKYNDTLKQANYMLNEGYKSLVLSAQLDHGVLKNF